MQTAHSLRWAGARRHRVRAVHGHHGHVDHRRGPARDPRRRRLHARQPVLGLQRLVIAFCGLLPLGGRPSDLFGAKRLFGLGRAVLAAGSLGAGLADSTGVEIAARAVKGAGAALIAPSALTLLIMLFGSNPRSS